MRVTIAITADECERIVVEHVKSRVASLGKQLRVDKTHNYNSFYSSTFTLTDEPEPPKENGDPAPSEQ